MSNTAAIQLLNATPKPQPLHVIRSWSRKKVTKQMLKTWNGDYSPSNIAYRTLLLNHLESMP